MLFNLELIAFIVLFLLCSMNLAGASRQIFFIVCGLILVAALNPVITVILIGSSLVVLARQHWISSEALILSLIGFCVYCLGTRSVEPSLFFGVESWFFLIFSLQRHLHLLVHAPKWKEKPDVLVVLSYLWNPAIMMGSAELFSDYAQGMKREKPAWREFLRNLALAYSFGYGAEFLRVYFTEGVYQSQDLQSLSFESLGMGVLLVGPAFFLGMSAIFYFSRALLALFGCVFTEPLFGRVYWAKSPVEFWLSWNIPTVRVLRECFFQPLLVLYGRFGVWPFLLSLGLWWLLQGLWHTNLIWAMIHALAVGLQVAWIRFSVLNPKVHRIRNKLKPLFPLTTMGFILISASIWPGQRLDILLELFFRIFSSVAL